MDSPTRLGETTFPLPFSGDIDQDPQVVSLGRLTWAFFRWIRKTDSCIPCEFDLSSACLSVLTRQNGSHAAARFLRQVPQNSSRMRSSAFNLCHHGFAFPSLPEISLWTHCSTFPSTSHSTMSIIAKASNTGEGEESKEMPRFGRGQRKRIANTLYNDFWSHK